MRNLLLASVFAVGSCSAFGATNDPAAASDIGSSFNLVNLAQVNIDLKAIGEDKGDFGLDYKLNLTHENIPLAKPDWLHTWESSLKSAGFITLDDEENELNSLVSELNLAAVYRQKPKGPPPGRGSIGDVLGATNDMEAARSISHMDRMFRAPLWVHWNLHAKHETTQDFEDYDFAIGTGLIVETRYLNRILDFPFRLLRWGSDAENNNPRFLDASAGYDYVFGLDQTANAALRDGEDEAHRIYTKVEWETGIFVRQRFVIGYHAHFEIDAPSQIRSEGKDVNEFLQIRIDLLRWTPAQDLNASVSIKYTTGELPPNYTTGHVLGGGFSIEF